MCLNVQIKHILPASLVKAIFLSDFAPINFLDCSEYCNECDANGCLICDDGYQLIEAKCFAPSTSTIQSGSKLSGNFNETTFFILILKVEWLQQLFVVARQPSLSWEAQSSTNGRKISSSRLLKSNPSTMNIILKFSRRVSQKYQNEPQTPKTPIVSIPTESERCQFVP